MSGTTRRGLRWLRRKVDWARPSSANVVSTAPLDLANVHAVLDKFGVTDVGLLIVYSAWEKMRLEMHPNKFIDALLDRISGNGCLAFPTASFPGMFKDYLASAPEFNVQRDPSCRGLLSEIARRRKDSLRTLHPGAPFSLLGPDAERYATLQSDFTSPYTEDSFLAEAHRQNAMILTVGVNFIQNTSVHFVEKRLDQRLGLYSRERLPFTIRDGESVIRAETHYLYPASRDWEYVHAGYKDSPSFHEAQIDGVDFSCIRENDSYRVFETAILSNHIRCV